MVNPGQTVCDMLQPDAVLESSRKLLAQMEGLNRAWLGGWQEVTESQWDLVARLSRCADPFEASRAYADWLEGQSELLATQGRRISDQWFKLYQPPSEPQSTAKPAAESRPTTPPLPTNEAKPGGQPKQTTRPIAAAG